MPCEQTLQQPTPSPSGTRWSEDVSHKPSLHNEPPIPGPSQPSKPHEDASTHEPEPEVALTQSMEEPFGKYFFYCFPVPNFPSPLLQPSPVLLATPASVIIIDNMPIGTALPFLHPRRSLPLPTRTQPPLTPGAKLPSFPQ
ncbi:hypothetical protein O181_087174 [Austropuccinia psidii MF-1]|uniref:Uncharacterized protein n=1 Tax=Austropuccinia psidii MF-1 TaxID=1389203 RepID=A0A9Q3P145_9BASI|nr:hypothetical protein [Austropuccinia psidii MF-1]